MRFPIPYGPFQMLRHFRQAAETGKPSRAARHQMYCGAVKVTIACGQIPGFGLDGVALCGWLSLHREQFSLKAEELLKPVHMSG